MSQDYGIRSHRGRIRAMWTRARDSMLAPVSGSAAEQPDPSPR